MLVSPPEMEHNTNLHTDVTYFVLPMLQFFSLPDYCFDELRVPDWAYDKRLCVHYRGEQGNRPAMLSPRMPSPRDGRLSPREGNDFTGDDFRRLGLIHPLNGGTDIVKPAELRWNALHNGDSLELAANSAVSRYLRNKALGGRGLPGDKGPEPDDDGVEDVMANRQENSDTELVLDRITDGTQNTDDELPMPPGEEPFLKVPRTGKANPGSTANGRAPPVVKTLEAAKIQGPWLGTRPVPPMGDTEGVTALRGDKDLATF